MLDRAQTDTQSRLAFIILTTKHERKEKSHQLTFDKRCSRGIYTILTEAGICYPFSCCSHIYPLPTYAPHPSIHPPIPSLFLPSER